jgi:hypothetical protein
VFFLTKHHAMKAYWGVELHSFFDLGIRLRRVVSFTPRPLYPQGKSPWYPLDRRLGRPQSRSGRGGEEKNSQPPPGIERYFPDHPAPSLVAISTDLSRLLTLYLKIFSLHLQPIFIIHNHPNISHALIIIFSRYSAGLRDGRSGF